MDCLLGLAGLSAIAIGSTDGRETALLAGNLRGFQHLGIPVIDINQAKAWYTDVFGFEVVHEPQVATPEGDIKVAFLKKKDITLELYQLVGKDLEEVRNRGHGHIDHFAIDAADIEKGVRQAEAAGALLDEASQGGIQTLPTFWAKGVKYAIFTGPSREKVELNQRIGRPGRDENLNGWSHLGIPAKDINESRRFYKRFGFKEVMHTEISEPAGVIKVAMMEKDTFVIELYQLYGDALEEIVRREDGHIDHVAFDVADIDKAYSELKEAGLSVLEDAPVKLDFWKNGVKYFNVRGPSGERLEFSQML